MLSSATETSPTSQKHSRFWPYLPSKKILIISAIALVALSNIQGVRGGEVAYQACFYGCKSFYLSLSFIPLKGKILQFLLWMQGGTDFVCACKCAPFRLIPWI